jgi:hypothetical protein
MAGQLLVNNNFILAASNEVLPAQGFPGKTNIGEFHVP